MLLISNLGIIKAHKENHWPSHFFNKNFDSTSFILFSIDEYFIIKKFFHFSKSIFIFILIYYLLYFFIFNSST